MADHIFQKCLKHFVQSHKLISKFIFNTGVGAMVFPILKSGELVTMAQMMLCRFQG